MGISDKYRLRYNKHDLVKRFRTITSNISVRPCMAIFDFPEQPPSEVNQIRIFHPVFKAPTQIHIIP